jgi:hypothetical protein
LVPIFGSNFSKPKFLGLMELSLIITQSNKVLENQPWYYHTFNSCKFRQSEWYTEYQYGRGNFSGKNNYVHL